MQDDSLKIPDPLWKVKISVASSSTTTNYESLLSLHPLYTFLTRERLRTIVPNGEAVKMEVVPSDIISAELISLKDESQKVSWENLKAEEFVNLTDCAKCEEGLRFGMSNTRYDNWNHKELFFFGLDLPKEKYPGSFEEELEVFARQKV